MSEEDSILISLFKSAIPFYTNVFSVLSGRYKQIYLDLTAGIIVIGVFPYARSMALPLYSEYDKQCISLVTDHFKTTFSLINDEAPMMALH